MTEFTLEGPFELFQEQLVAALSAGAEGDLVMTFSGEPWNREEMVWPADALRFRGEVRQDIIALAWTKCKLATVYGLGRTRASVYDGTLEADYGRPLLVRCKVG